MHEILFWVYLINATLIINHEIDSAYWKEWELFKLPFGIRGFLILHLPILALILYGLVAINEKSSVGLIFSLLLGLSGIIAFSLHSYFIKIGRSEFKTLISMFILTATFIMSLAQIAITISMF